MSTIATDTAAWIDGEEVQAIDLRVHQDMVHLPSDLPRPNPRWEFTDRNGHFHAYDNDLSLPTLTYATFAVDCDGSCGGVCDGTIEKIEWRCLICADLIEPGMLEGSHISVISGMRSWSVILRMEGRPPQAKTASIKIREGSSIYFGVGEAGTFQVDRGLDGGSSTVTYVGVSPLGSRKA